MPYRMNYSSLEQEKGTGSWLRRVFLTMLLFTCFLQLLYAFWPEGQNMLRIFLIPGDPERTLEAAEVFAQEMECGYSLVDAAKNFCASVQLNGNTG